MRRLLCGLLLACLPLAAACADTATPLVRVVVLRHGVRAPTSGPAELAPYANRDWHAWPVVPGMLTEHGAQGMTALGARYRRLFAADGTWSGQCDARDQLVIIADSTPRNRASGAALARGLAPDCAAPYLALPETQSNPLFHFGKEDKDDDLSAAPATWPPAALAELQSVLLGCTGDDCLAQARSHQRKLLLDAADDRARAKALKQAGSLSENLMLEYAQGFPAATVAWGQGDEAAIGRLIGLHNLQFDLAKRRMPAAARGGSNLLAHILATLQRAAGMETPVAPLASADARVVLLVAHDTNLAQLGGLLDVDWRDARQPDEYPPGGALVFDLVREHGVDSVRLSSWMPTPDALRRADVSRPDALVRRTLGLPACDGKASCPLPVFAHWLEQRVDPAAYDPAMPALPANLP